MVSPPIDFINKNIGIRLNYLKNCNNFTVRKDKSKFQKSKKWCLPFNACSVPEFNSFLKKYNIAPIYKNVNKLDGIIRLGKGKMENLEKQLAVYKIHCNECPSINIGQRFIK